MRNLVRFAIAAVVMLGGLVASAAAEGLKDAKDVKIAVVVHGSASDAYWSVVKRGVDDAAAAERLKSLGCDVIQGDHVGPLQDAATFIGANQA